MTKIFQDSLRDHQINGKGIVGFSQVVTLHSSENPHFNYPVKGIITIIEQGNDLSIVSAVFRQFRDDGSLNAPVVVKNPVFTHHDKRVPDNAPLPRMNRRVYHTLVEAERFISGFEDDALQEGIPVLLSKLRTIIVENQD
jgi:hypothetical protein